MRARQRMPGGTTRSGRGRSGDDRDDGGVRPAVHRIRAVVRSVHHRRPGRDGRAGGCMIAAAADNWIGLGLAVAAVVYLDVIEILALVALLGITVVPLGRYIAAVYGSRADGSAPGDRVFAPVERAIYRVCRVDAHREQRWNVYASSLLAFSLVSMLGLYAVLRLQGTLPFNPTGSDGVSATGAFNIAVSFVTNTNWQWYSGEVAMSHLSQMVGLAVQNFVSAGVGFAVIVAMIRGITRTRHRSRTLGNFWVDLVRGTIRILLPLSFLFALVLVSQGVVQNLGGGTTATVVDAASGTTEQ
eukprot:gene21345-41375_t